jgi:hypothetical protein
MERKGAAAVAFVAGLVTAVVIAAAGNQWYLEHIATKSSSNGANAILKRVPAAFGWRLSHWSGDHGLRLGEVVGCAAVIILVFLITWTVVRAQRRPRGFFGPLFSIWGVVLFSAVISAMAQAFVSYNGLFPSHANPLGTTRFWWSVLEGPSAPVILWGLAVGFVVALICALITVGQRAEEPAEEEPRRPEDAFFPPRTPQLAAPAPAVSSAAGNPELAAYGWSPEDAASRTSTLPTSGDAQPWHRSPEDGAKDGTAHAAGDEAVPGSSDEEARSSSGDAAERTQDMAAIDSAAWSAPEPAGGLRPAPETDPANVDRSTDNATVTEEMPVSQDAERDHRRWPD